MSRGIGPDVGAIMDYEAGELDDKGVLNLFGDLVACGMAWSLQGHYGRTATALIDAGLLDKRGVVNWSTYDEMVDDE